MPARTKVTAVKIDHEDLVQVGEELNNLMFEPGKGINVDADDATLQAGIIEASKELMPEDTITDFTKDVLTKLGCFNGKAAVKAEPAPAAPPKKAEKAPAAAPEKKAEAPKDLPTLVADTSKLSDLKVIVSAHAEFAKLRDKIDTFSGLRGPAKLKEEMFKMLGVEPQKKAAAPAVKKEKAPKHATRPEVMADIARSMAKKALTREEITTQMQTTYGGTLTEAKYQTGLYVGLLSSLGLLTEKDKKFTYVG